MHALVLDHGGFLSCRILIAVNLTECGDGYDELTLIARPSCGYILQLDRVPFAIELELLGLFYCQLRPSLKQCSHAHVQ